MVETIPFDSIYVPLAAALGLSLTIERIIELAKNLFERILGKRKGRKIPEDREFEKMIATLEKEYQRDKLAREIEKKAVATEKERKKILAELRREKDPLKRKALKEQLIALEEDGEWDEQFPSATVLVEPATDPDDGKKLKVMVIQLMGFAAGIIAVHYSGIQLFNCFLEVLNQNLYMPKELDFLLTGLLIGGGSGPMHMLVRFISQRKIIISQENISEVEERPSSEENMEAPALITEKGANSDSQWIDIPYKGGVDREILEHVHIRKKNPDLIVYHHTAMSQTSTFEDVVRVIKNKRDSQGNPWLTGFNCVVLADGSVHPFCRWDRFGNHAVGYNERSLGIALNGNFETDPAVPFSNPDGRYGSARPTENQLKSAARVVTLWTFLYNIEVDFNKTIIPHHELSSKSCPGSAFLYDEFQKWVEFYKQRWDRSDEIKEKIEAFKLKPYLYVK